jgi:hypothetical protein
MLVALLTHALVLRTVSRAAKRRSRRICSTHSPAFSAIRHLSSVRSACALVGRTIGELMRSWFTPTWANPTESFEESNTHSMLAFRWNTEVSRSGDHEKPFENPR